MANPSPNDLNYGHVGQAVFDLENGAWDFGRTIGQRNHLIQLGAWKEVLAPATKFGQIGTQRHAQTIHNAQFFARALGHNNPGLVPSLDLLPELAVTSSAVTSTVSAYDPAIGPLLSYGSFTFKDHHENPRRVAALPAGECGNILRLVALRKEKHGWGPDKSIWIEGPSIVSEESGYWAEDAAPIQQVCFAQGDMRSSFLAVRFPIRTVLFRPIYRADRTSPKRNEYYELPYSKIDAQFILDIHNEQTGGTAHADVVFNPDYQRQVGLVDQKGNWSVWDIEGGKREGKSYALSCTAQGNIALQDADQMQELEDSVPVTRDDAWARILWIGDVNTILVCNRRSIGIFDTRSKAPASLECAELIAKRSADWILDVKSHPRNKRQFFVLTSTRLFLLAVTCLNDVSHNSGANAGASVLMAWTHFQGSEDITLQLCVPTTSDEDCMVLVYSRLTPLVMVYRFQDSESNVSLSCSSSDPTILRLEKDLLESMEIVRHISHLNVEQLRYEGGHKHYGADAGHVYFNNDVRFYRLSAMLSDLSVHQLILYSHEPEISTATQMRLVVKPLGWATIVHPRRQMLMETLIDVDDDNFVVQDEIEASTMPKFKKPYRTPKIVNDRKTTASQSAGAVVNLDYLYDALTSNEAAPVEGENVEVESKDVSVVIDHVKSLLVADVETKEIPRETLMGFAGHMITVLDIDESSSRLYDLCTHERHPKPVELRYIASPQALHFLTSNHDEHDLTMSFLYDTFLQYWIAPLPVNIPTRVRQSKEKLARRIAAEVLLASMRIRHAEPYPSTEQTDGSQVGMSWESGSALPTLPSVREESGPDDIEIASSQPWWPSSQLLPAAPSPSTLSTPNHSSTLSTLSSSIPSRPSNPITRLSQHLKINNPPPEIRQGVGKVLAHWTPGSDPSTYDWEATTQSLDQEEDEESQQQREKAKRKQERLKKRQRREEEIARGRGGMESQPPYALEQLSMSQIPRRSPGPGIGGMGEFDTGKVGGSSQSHSQGMPFIQSQVEPGRHGGRPVKKKKKLKVRVSGF